MVHSQPYACAVTGPPVRQDHPCTRAAELDTEDTTQHRRRPGDTTSTASTIPEHEDIRLNRGCPALLPARTPTHHGRGSATRDGGDASRPPYGPLCAFTLAHQDSPAPSRPVEHGVEPSCDGRANLVLASVCSKGCAECKAPTTSTLPCCVRWLHREQIAGPLVRGKGCYNCAAALQGRVALYEVSP